MKLSVEYKPKAIADLEKLTQAVRDRMIGKINWLAENFDQPTFLLNSRPIFKFRRFWESSRSQHGF